MIPGLVIWDRDVRLRRLNALVIPVMFQVRVLLVPFGFVPLAFKVWDPAEKLKVRLSELIPRSDSSMNQFQVLML